MISRPTDQAQNSCAAAVLPRLLTNLRTAEESVRESVSEFGGQPVPVREPVWPVGAQPGKPLVFIGQFRVVGDARAPTGWGQTARPGGDLGRGGTGTRLLGAAVELPERALNRSRRPG
ncbi:hypothetical protein ABZ387_26535 [Streptomyces flaveolus]|uniref:hypothetical protein n=1 Tax=Streptomyces flaveolus TaxID=67297 RepID=UPI0033CA3C24